MIEVPPAVARRIARAAKQQKRNPSEVATEAILWYFSRRTLPVEAATPAEMRAIRRGEAAFRKGDYVT
jgi:predicted transcriptional regulator